MSVDVLAIGPHPDDVELFCGGTLAKLVRLGYRVGILDMTRGELASRGTVADRDAESAEASQHLGVHVRENLNLPDGGINARDEHQRQVMVNAIRKHQPRLILGPAAQDRHPDHLQGASLVEEAVFLSYVGGYKTEHDRHKVDALLRYPMWWMPPSDIVVDVSRDWDAKMKAVQAYRTQFHTPGVEGPKTFLASEQFLSWVEGRGAMFGAVIGVPKGEPYLLRNPVPVGDPFQLLVKGPGAANP